MRKCTRILAAILAVLSLGAVVATTYYKEQLPDFFYVKSGQDLQLQSDVVQLEKSVLEEKYQSASGPAGGYTAQAKLFGLFPIKEVKVNVMSQGKVIPCGMPFGIKMFTQGVMVVGMSDVTTASGKNARPSWQG